MVEIESLGLFWEGSENQFGRLKEKKGRENFLKFFENNDKILYPPHGSTHSVHLKKVYQKCMTTIFFLKD